MQQLSHFEEEVCTCSCAYQSNRTGKDAMRVSVHDSDMLNLIQLNHLRPHVQVNLNQVNLPKRIHLMKWITLSKLVESN